MTSDEAIESIKSRAPMADIERQASQRPSTVGAQEEAAYLLARWVKKNGTDEELAAIGMIR